jgi:DNA ligase-associated metallophosphoesterase
MNRDDCRILVNGETLVLDASGAAWWPAERTLVVADLHFEKGSAYARRGQFLPPYDTRATLKRIAVLITRFGPERVIALGDSFHDGDAGARLSTDDIAALAALTGAVAWVWIEGNHDPKPPAWLGGTITGEVAIGGLVFRHVPVGSVGEVAGHLHPAARITRGGMSTRKRCFVSDGMRLLLPAFGAYTGGLDVREAAIASLFADGFAVYAMGRDRVYAVAGALPEKWTPGFGQEARPKK